MSSYLKGVYMNQTTLELLIHGQFYPDKEFFKETKRDSFKLASKIFSFFSQPKKVKNVIKKIWEYEPIDYLKVTVYRIIDTSHQIIFKKSLFDPSSLSTKLQKERNKKIHDKIEKFGKDSPLSIFSKSTSELVYKIIPRTITQLSFDNLSFLEMQVLYKSGICIRYLNYKINQHTNYRSYLLKSKVSELFKRYFFSSFTKINSTLLQESNINPIFDFELIFLTLCEKLQPNSDPKGQYSTLKDVIIQSIARSVELAFKCDEALNEKIYDDYSEDEKLIERIDWYKRNNALPKGICDSIGLDTKNLSFELDKALLSYIKTLSTDLLDKNDLAKNKSIFIKFLYWLEGKDFLIEILKILIGEVCVKQVIDPHLFTMAILASLGNEIADYEIDGFGIGKLNQIYDVGRKMLSKKINNRPPPKIIDVFKKFNLKSKEKGSLGIYQQKLAKKELSDKITQMIYNAIKEDKKYSHGGIIKDAKKMMQPIPIFGTATTCLHFAVNTLSFSYTYFVTQKKESFFEWMARNLAGQDLCQNVKNKILDLIYHPSIRFLILQLIEDVHRHMLHKEKIEKEKQNEITIKNLKIINSFIIKHFMRDFPAGIDTGINYFASDAMVNLFKEFLKPSEKPFYLNLFEAIIPKVKETLLCWKLCDILKKDAILFENDEKFWELYIRHYLNEIVLIELEKNNIKDNNDEKIKMRELLINNLLKLSDSELLEKITEEMEPVFYEIKKEEENQINLSPQIPQYFGEHRVIEDYEPEL